MAPRDFPQRCAFHGVDTQADGETPFPGTATGTRQTLIEQGWDAGGEPQRWDGHDGATRSAAIAGTGRLWAVGWRQSPSGLQPLILRYDTTQPSPTWVSVSWRGNMPAPGTIDTVLTGVDVLSASDVWPWVTTLTAASTSHWRCTGMAAPGATRRCRDAAQGQGARALGTFYNANVRATVWSISTGRHGRRWFRPTPLRVTPRSSALAKPGGRCSPWWAVAGLKGGRAAVGTRLAPSRDTGALPVPVTSGGSAPAPEPTTTAAAPATTQSRGDHHRPGSGGAISGRQDWTLSARPLPIFNGDGWPDVFIARHWHTADLWLNNQDGTFSPSDAMYFQQIKDRHDCEAADFDDDGLEICCSVGADRGSAVKANALYIQQPDGTFGHRGLPGGRDRPVGARPVRCRL